MKKYIIGINQLEDMTFDNNLRRWTLNTKTLKFY